MAYYGPDRYGSYNTQVSPPPTPPRQGWAYDRRDSEPSGDVAAPVRRRVVARLIDIAVAVPLSFVFILPVGVLFIPLMFAVEKDGDVYDTLTSVGAWICILLAFVAIEWLLLVRRQGQTLGKGLMGLRVVREDKRAEAVPWASGFLRMLVLLGLNYSPALLVAWPVNLVVVLVNRKRKSLHDFAAGTRVVRAPKRGLKIGADLMMALPVPQRVDMTKRP